MLNNGGCLGQAPCVQMAHGKRQLLLRYPTSLDVWQLGAAAPSAHQLSANTFLKLSQEPARLLQLKAKDDEWIVCATVSPGGDYVAYATESNVYIYHFIQVFIFISAAAALARRPNQWQMQLFSYGLLAAVHDGLILGHIDRAVGWNVATEKTGVTGRSRHLPPDDVHPSTGKPSTGHRHAGIDCAAGGRLPVRDESRSHVQQREQILRRRLHPFDGQ